MGLGFASNRGHLVIEDGIGATRSETRLARVAHGLRRLVVIGSDGMISLAALRWLTDQDAAFVMLDRDGSVLATTGPVRPSDARLRRAQALASQSEAALEISRELIRQKLVAQEQLVDEKLNDGTAAQAIAKARAALSTANTIEALRVFEARAAHAYWSAWRNIPISFPKNDLRRIPEHWRTFGTRISPLTGSPRLAVNPPNAMLNYLYALLESEARLAATALGLDPGLGVMHVDSRTRDSLASDLMEPARPRVDAYLLDWITREPLRREWFFEQRDGTCRLMGSFAVRLSETAATWGYTVAPVAEWFSSALWSTIAKPVSDKFPATPLTERHRRQGRGSSSPLQSVRPPRPLRVCRGCGAAIVPGNSHCSACGVVFATEELIKAAERGRVAAQAPEAQARRAETQRRNATAQHAWTRSDHPPLLNEETYRREIQPRLLSVTVPALMAALKVCESYAADIRAGRRRPHPRHWQGLAQLVGVSTPDS